MTRILTIIFVMISGSGLLGQAVPAIKPGEQVEAEFQTADKSRVPFLIYTPKQYKTDGEKKFPLMLFLHGRGESEGPLSNVAKWGPPLLVTQGNELPFVIVSPQCPAKDFWSSEKQLGNLAELLEHVEKSYSIDSSRIYLTGLSMGGFGSWSLAAKHPDRFAAVVPICGGGDVAVAEKLKDIPIWAFHGSDDEIVPIRLSSEIVEAIKNSGGTKIRFTSMEHIGHNSWSPAYATPELYQWLLKHKLTKDK